MTGVGHLQVKKDMVENDPTSRFYLKHLNVPWQETITADCPFCERQGEGRLVVFLNRESFFYGYFRCLNRCVPGGFPLWFAHLAGIAKEEVPGYDPDWDMVEQQPEFPVENLNQEVRNYQERITPELYTLFKEHGVGKTTLREMDIGFNGRYLVYPYFQEDGNCYSARCIFPGQPEDFFWHGDERFSREPFTVFNVRDLRCCENGALFVCEGEDNLLPLKQLGFPGIAIAHYSGIERLPATLFTRIRTVFICVGNSPEADNASRNLASRIGYKARLLKWPANAGRRYNLWQMAREKGADFAGAFSRMVKNSRAFSPFSTPKREYSMFLQNLAAQQSAEYKALDSGFGLLDQALGGIHGLNIIGGAPKVGKSTFVIQIASTMARRKIPVLYYDFENGRQKIYQRTLSRLARLETQRLDDGTLGVEEKKRLHAGRTSLENMLHYWRVINDRKITPELMRKHVEFIRHETRSTYTVVIVDSLHKLPFKEFSERRSGIDAWLRQMESIRDELHVSFLVISELSREGTGSYRQTPHLGVFKGSGDIEYSADNAMVLFPKHGEERETGGGWAQNVLWLVASREHSPGRVAEYHLDYPFWGFREVPLTPDSP